MDKEKSRGGGTHLKAPKSSVPDDLWDDLPLSEPPVAHPIQRRLVSRDSETGPVFCTGLHDGQGPF